MQYTRLGRTGGASQPKRSAQLLPHLAIRVSIPLTAPELAVKAAILNGFGHVRRLNVLLAP